MVEIDIAHYLYQTPELILRCRNIIVLQIDDFRFNRIVLLLITKIGIQGVYDETGINDLPIQILQGTFLQIKSIS